MWRLAIWTASGLLGWGAILVGVALADAVWGLGLFAGPLESILYAFFYPTAVAATVALVLSARSGVAAWLGGTATGVCRAGAGLAVAVAALAFSVQGIDEQLRSSERARFRSAAQHHLAGLTPRLAAALPAESTVRGRPLETGELDALIAGLNERRLVRHAALYLPDPADPQALWRYRPEPREIRHTAWTRILVDEAHERAIRAKFRGNGRGIEHFNAGDDLVWFEPVASGERRAILVVVGREAEGLRQRAATMLGA